MQRASPCEFDGCESPFAPFVINGKRMCGDHWRTTEHYQGLVASHMRESVGDIDEEDGDE